MNIFKIFMESSITAQIIMIVLIIFSIWSWAIFFKKLFEFARFKSRARHFLSTYRLYNSISELNNLGHLLNNNAYGRILRNGLEEFKKLRLINIHNPNSPDAEKKEKTTAELSDNIRLVMERAKISELSELESSLPILGTFVSVSPFLGLLGTVWGVMEAFFDIRARGSAHITIVAPGISDALITTVYGLMVAIPALIFYNIFRTRVNRHSGEIDRFINEVFVRLRKALITGQQ